MRTFAAPWALPLAILAQAGCPGEVRSNPPMSAGFEKAQSAFREFAAARYQIAAKKVQVGPPSAAVSDNLKVSAGHLPPISAKVGGAWPFEASADGKADLRGWALPDGRVISARDNLGLLFQEAGVWSGSASVSAMNLAWLIAWSLGGGVAVDLGQGPPALKVDGSGSGALTFGLTQRPAGGGTFAAATDCTVTLTPEHKATLATTPRGAAH